MGGDSHLTGHSLYARIHQIAGSAGTISETTGEAWVNTNIVFKLLPKALQKISLSECAHPESFQSLQVTVDEIIRQMTIPLVQNLIQKINVHNTPQIKLYATAVLPQIAACDWRRYEFLKTHLIDDYVESRKNDVIMNIQASYSCMGITCDQVGYSSSTCVDSVENMALAGYLPAADIREVSCVYFCHKVLRHKWKFDSTLLLFLMKLLHAYVLDILTDFFNRPRFVAN